ncbi:MAG TPA: hypothetical protein PLL20_01105 [Phycisphaerae bacterium]|jgi:hypothetical protein|nr:hypothetical protein [Phycisphaerae bacterium]HRR84748.1 hypothetical protein [Phycisphaerae bacterium]
MTTNANNKTAAETYATRRHEVARLMDVLEMELKKYDDQAAAKPKDWGFAGTMAHVRECLIDLVEGLSGIERSEIERFLSE